MKINDLIFREKWIEINLSTHVNYIKNHKGVWLSHLEYLYGGSLYGGYMENRSPFFDERHDPGCVIHVGVDLWVSEFTPVTFPYNAVVKYSRPENKICRGGWGGRLDLYVPDQGVFILGHLLEPTQKIGEHIVAGEIIGSLAGRNKNGGWKPHLHIQLMNLEYYDLFEPNHIDAYAPYSSDLKELYPNPIDNEIYGKRKITKRKT
jgi:hypothetical protein